MLKLIFVETALELVPDSISTHPSVVRNARRRGKKPEESLLDRSLHHFAMRQLSNAEKRGRPDIIHFCLLEALGSPLNHLGGLVIWINTILGKTIEVNPEVRLPRDFFRFKSLIEQLLTEGEVPPGSDEPLLSVRNLLLDSLIEEVDPSLTVALTSHGEYMKLEDLCGRLVDEERPAVMIGGYPKGPMESETISNADERVSVYPEPLEAWTVTSRLIYEFEKQSRLY
ncbi:MAG: 16S rRNA methyltransferase [Candidatus Bathyarchaeia archaeon]